MHRPKLLILGIDGFCREVYDYARQRIDIPTITRLMEDGLSAPLRSTLLPTSGTAWTSLCTGVNPGRHGITGFTRWERQGKAHTGVALFNSHDLPVEYFWETIARSAGLRSLVIRVPCTYPARPFAGAMVVEQDFSIATAWPPELQPLLDAPENKVKEHWLGEGWENHAGDVIRKTGRMTRALYAETRPDICFVVFYVLDFVHHRIGYQTPLFLDMVKTLDETLSTLLTMDEFTDLAVVSDHGMRSYGQQFLLDAWLRRKGYLAWPAATNYLDGDATRVYCTPSDIPGNYGKLFLNRSLVPAFAMGQLLDEVEAALRAETLDGIPLITDIWRRDQVYAGPHQDRMPDLVFRTTPSVRVASLWEPRAVLREELVTDEALLLANCHSRHGIFAWHNSEIPACALDAPLDITDVPAWVLSRYGVPLPDNLESRPPEATLGLSALFPRLPVQPAVYPQLAAVDSSLEHQAQTIESLRSLGYM